MQTEVHRLSVCWRRNKQKLSVCKRSKWTCPSMLFCYDQRRQTVQLTHCFIILSIYELGKGKYSQNRLLGVEKLRHQTLPILKFSTVSFISNSFFKSFYALNVHSIRICHFYHECGYQINKHIPNLVFHILNIFLVSYLLVIPLLVFYWSAAQQKDVSGNKHYTSQR
jgi:hypothetical protein